MENENTANLTQIAYEVYAERQNWKDARGEQLADWANLHAQVKSAWIAAITAVLDLAK
jgi:hypothetical protein